MHVWQTILLYTSNLSALLAIFIGRSQKHVLWYYAIASFVFDINGLVLKHFGVQRHWASNLFVLIEFLLITRYFIGELIKEPYKRNAYRIMCLIALLFTIQTINVSIWQANYLGASILYSIYIGYCLAGLYKVISEIEYVHIEVNPLFIFCTAFLLYASGILIILLFKNEIFEKHRELVISIWQIIHNPLNIIKNLLLAYGLWLLNKRR